MTGKSRLDPPPCAGPLRVLVVDDYPDSAESTAQVLGLWGYEAQVAHDGPHALEIFRTYRPRVVLLDLAMPKMDGYRLAELFRQQAEGEGPVLVALTGRAHEDERRRCLQAGFQHFFAKPVEPDALLDLLQSCTETR